MTSHARITKTHQPTLLGLAAVADATGLHMLSDTFLRTHDQALGVFAEGRAPERSRMAALGEIEQAIKVWKDAEETERAFGMGSHGDPMARIQKALRMLDVTRALLGGASGKGG
jgi:hypothetical protein